jgi:hypothetical protein
MNQSPLTRLSEQYLAALQIHLGNGPHAMLKEPQELGREAVSIGLEALELARVHNQALDTLLKLCSDSTSQRDLIDRAADFFIEAILPIEGTHSAALETATKMKQLSAVLDQKTSDLADSKLKLQQVISERQTAQESFANYEQSTDRLLRDSRSIEAGLQKIVHNNLHTAEQDRKKMSLHINNEIAQHLLGIKIRMLALNQKVASDHVDFNNEITLLQQLIEDSMIMFKQLAHESNQ